MNFSKCAIFWLDNEIEEMNSLIAYIASRRRDMTLLNMFNLVVFFLLFQNLIAFVITVVNPLCFSLVVQEFQKQAVRAAESFTTIGYKLLETGRKFQP